MTASDGRLSRLLDGAGRHAPAAGRLVIGLAFGWSGLLHVTGQHPQGHLASALFYGFQPAEAHHFVGAIEITAGLLLISGIVPRVGLAIVAVQTAGVLLVAWLTVDQLRRGEHPLLLSTSGLFLIQYAALAATAAGLLAAHVWSRPARAPDRAAADGSARDRMDPPAGGSAKEPARAAPPTDAERMTPARHEGRDAADAAGSGDWVSLMDDASRPTRDGREHPRARWIEL